jgi:hypothetical protein
MTMLPSAPATVPLRRRNFPLKNKQPAYLRLLCDAATHPEAPAKHRAQLEMFAREEARRCQVIDAEIVETAQLTATCGAEGAL